MIRIFIGYDYKESVAYHVLCQSIMDHASGPVSFTPIYLNNLPFFTRERDPKQSTDFSFSRFLVPYLCGYEGKALFVDCDMLCLGDVYDLFDKADGSAVQVVQHDYTPKTTTKFLGNVQTVYAKKNWSSVMLFNCSHPDCANLTPEYVNTATGLELHQFKWTQSVGAIPAEWNYLVGEQESEETPSMIHYTLGGPYFIDHSGCEYAGEWMDALKRTTHCDQ